MAGLSNGYPTLGPLIFRETIALCLTAAALVAFRLWQTYKRRGWLGLDEAMVVASLICLIVLTAIACQAVMEGFGMTKTDLIKAGGNLEGALFVIYKVNICLNKLAFCTLYLRIFPQRNVRQLCWSTIGVVLVGTLAFVIATITECLPVRKSWERKSPGHCINNTAFRWSWAGYNTVTDLWICLLPLPFIWSLQMSILKKIGTMLMFGLGLFAVATSAIRMSALVRSVSSTDPTYDSAPALCWSHVEVAVGLIATCLPSLRAPIAKLVPSRIAGISNSRSKNSTGYRLGARSQDGGSVFNKAMGGRANNAIEISTMAKYDHDDDRDSQEHILGRGIHVQRDISVTR